MNDATLLPEPVVVDLEALKKRCLGNLDLVDRVLRKFTTQLDCDLAELERALTAGDAESFALVAHRIKGMSANVEAKDLYHTAAQAERHAIEKQVEKLAVSLEQMAQERTRIALALPKLQAKAC